jgi:hypothetical protein
VFTCDKDRYVCAVYICMCVFMWCVFTCDIDGYMCVYMSCVFMWCVFTCDIDRYVCGVYVYDYVVRGFMLYR